MDVLEVVQVWGDLRLSVGHFRPVDDTVSVGNELGWRWALLGVDLGWVPEPMQHVLPWAPPIWSEVECQPRDAFYAPGNEGWTLFKRDGNRWIARIDRRWKAHMTRGPGNRDPLDSGTGILEVPMEAGAVLYLEVEGVSFIARLVERAPRIGRNQSRDWAFISLLSLVAFLGLMFGTTMYLAPEPPTNQLVEIPKSAFVMLQQPHDPKPEPEPMVKKAGADKKKGGKAKDREGKAGKRDGDKKTAKASQLERKEHNRKTAEMAGVLGAISSDPELMAALEGGLNPGLGDSLGSYRGPRGWQVGTGGLGQRGSWLGGGGEYEGIGGPNTHGIGSGDLNYGSGSADLCPPGEPCRRPGQGITIGQPDPTVVGCLSRAVIDENVKRYLPRIKYCYQRNLQRHAGLSGKVVVKFVIASDGLVSKSELKSSTMENVGVEQCVTDQFLRMQFPECKRGIAIVSYPFLFSPG